MGSIEVNISEKIIYIFVFAVLIIAICVGVYASTYTPEQYGHTISQLIAPDPCSTGQYLKKVSGGWACGTPTTSGGETNLWSISGTNSISYNGFVGIGTSAAPISAMQAINSAAGTEGRLGTGGEGVYGQANTQNKYGVNGTNLGAGTYGLLGYGSVGVYGHGNLFGGAFEKAIKINPWVVNTANIPEGSCNEAGAAGGITLVEHQGDLKLLLCDGQGNWLTLWQE